MRLHSALYVAAGNNFALKSIATEGTCRLMRHMYVCEKEKEREREGQKERERGLEIETESCCVYVLIYL